MNWKDFFYWCKFILVMIVFAVVLMLFMKLRYEYDKKIIKDAIYESK